MSLFGGGRAFGAAKPATPGGLFGQPAQQNTGGGFFGNAQQQQTAQPAAIGGLFGAAPAQTTQSTFGQTQPAQTQQFGGLFGGGGNTSLFGQPQQQQQQQQQPQQNGMFGQTQQNQQGLSLFGNQQQQQNHQQGSIFGQNQQQQQQQNPMGNSMFGNNNTGNFNQSQNNMQQSQNQNQGGGNGPNIAAQMYRIAQAWDINDVPNCKFHYYFYNQAPDEFTASQQPCLDGEDKQKYDAAVRRKPNPKAFPVLARGFDHLKHRMDQQDKQIRYYQSNLHGINNKLEELSTTHNLHTSVKFQQALNKHQALAHRVLALTCKVQVLKNRGYAMQPEEEQLRKRLQELAKTIHDPGSVGRVNEIWARMTMVKEKARQMENEVNELSTSIDPAQIQKMALVLQSHEKGIQGLKAEVENIEKQFLAWEKEKAERGAGGR